MRLNAYLDRLENTLRSRSDVEIDDLRIRQLRGDASFRARVRFYDGSRLFLSEDLERISEREIRRIEFTFHYQSKNGTLIFRYDDTAHYPDLPTFPFHKHTPEGVIAAGAPDLTDVLQEINGILYP
jgi:hypothetical protein